MSNKRTFRLHWLGGDTQIIRGETIVEAMMLAGLGGGAYRALDYYEEIHEEHAEGHSGDGSTTGDKG